MSWLTCPARTGCYAKTQINPSKDATKHRGRGQCGWGVTTLGPAPRSRNDLALPGATFRPARHRATTNARKHRSRARKREARTRAEEPRSPPRRINSLAAGASSHLTSRPGAGTRRGSPRLASGDLLGGGGHYVPFHAPCGKNRVWRRSRSVNCDRSVCRISVELEHSLRLRPAHPVVPKGSRTPKLRLGVRLFRSGKPVGEECPSDRSADHPRDDRYDEANSPEPEQVADERPAACGEERVDASVHVRPLVNEGTYQRRRAD